MSHSRFDLILFYSPWLCNLCLCLFPFFKAIICHCLLSLPPCISLANGFALIPLSLTPLLSPSPIAFRLISPAHSFFSRSRVQLFKLLNLSACRFVFACICVHSMPIWEFVCAGDGSNITVAILLKNPWRNERKYRVCFIWWSVLLFLSSFHLLSHSASYSAALSLFMFSHRNRCGDAIIASLTQRAYSMCLHAHVGVHVTHICTCVLECLPVSPALTHRPGLRAAQTN